MKNILPLFSVNRLLTTVFALSIIGSGIYFPRVNAQESLDDPIHYAPEVMLESNESKFIDIIPTITTAENPEAPLPAETTHTAIRLTPDKSEIIKLKTDASSIIVGNPMHLSILADTPRTLVLVPKAVGATHFSILDKQGNILMQRHVLVAGPTTDYIRIKKTCVDDDEGCVATSVYYCPDICHEIISQGSEKTQTSVPVTTE